MKQYQELLRKTKTEIKVVKPSGAYATVVQHSTTSDGNDVLTVNVKYPLIIHAEFLRHRQLSRGVKSNRAIPTKKIRQEVLDDPYVPQWFGQNKSGMVSQQEVKMPRVARFLWKSARYPACGMHWLLEKVGLHKELCNRILNPFQWVRETITATEWDNLYNLRIHKDAQRDIKDIIGAIYEAHQQSTPVKLESGQWHVPYVDRGMSNHGAMLYFDTDGNRLTVEQAIKCATARCARSSYDNHDKSSATRGKDISLYESLVISDPAHASPVEHSCTPIQPMASFGIGNDKNHDSIPLTWEGGVTHVDREFNLWSGNFKGWIQHRQTLSSHVCSKYVPHED